MKSQGYFFGKTGKTGRLSVRIATISLICLTILIPTVIIAVDYIRENNRVPSKDTVELQVSMYYGDILIGEEKGDPATAEPGSLLSLLSKLQDSATPVESLPKGLDEEKALRMMFSKDGTTTEYRVYLSFQDKSSYWKNASDKSAFLLSDAAVHLLLESPYTQLLYDAATPPILYTTANEEVAPSKVTWKYRNLSEKWLEAKNIPTEKNILTSNMAGEVGLRFSVAPDTCTLTVKKGGLILHEYDDLLYTELGKITVDPSTTLRFSLTAVWENTPTRSFSGTVTYEFDSLMRDRSRFLLDKETYSLGGVGLLSCTNVFDAEKIQFSSEPSISYRPIFFEDGDTVRALLPFSSSLAPGSYTLTLTYGATVKTLNVTLTAPEGKDPFVSSLSAAEAQHRFGNDASAEYRALMEQLSAIRPSYCFIGGSFLSYQSEEVKKSIDFGSLITFAHSEHEHRSIGTEYTFAGQRGVSVEASNAGQVIFAGHCARLGNVVVVEHGFGLRTWYAHLSEIHVSEGDAVMRGQSVGKTGPGGLAGEESFLLLCTVFDIPVDYTLLEGKALSRISPEDFPV